MGSETRLPVMCGFVGIIGKDGVAADILLALKALKHRGQDSAGVGTINQGRAAKILYHYAPGETAD